MDTHPSLPANPEIYNFPIWPTHDRSSLQKNITTSPKSVYIVYDSNGSIQQSVIPLPFDEQIGNKISPEITKMLITLFPNILVMNVREFYRQFRRMPYASSGFMIFKNGSITCDYYCDYQGKNIHISIYNGTLKFICEKDTNNYNLKKIFNFTTNITLNEYHYQYFTLMNQ